MTSLIPHEALPSRKFGRLWAESLPGTTLTSGFSSLVSQLSAHTWTALNNHPHLAIASNRSQQLTQPLSVTKPDLLNLQQNPLSHAKQ